MKTIFAAIAALTLTGLAQAGDVRVNLSGFDAHQAVDRQAMLTVIGDAAKHACRAETSMEMRKICRNQVMAQVIEAAPAETRAALLQDVDAPVAVAIAISAE